MGFKDLDFITSKFGAMYCENQEGDYELYDVFLAEHNLKNNRFLISSGPSRGINSGAFNMVTSSQEEFFIESSKVDFEEFYDECDIAILFDNDFIDKIREEHDFKSEQETFTYLANQLSMIKLHRNADDSFFTKKYNGNIIYTEEDIYNICYNEDNCFSQEEFEKLAPYNLDLNESSLLGDLEELSPIDFLTSILGMPKMIMIQGQPMPNKEEKSYDELKKELESLKKRFQEERKEDLEKKRINTNEVIESTAKKIVGQENVIRTLVNQIFNNQLIINELSKEDELDITELDTRKTSILLDGETGTGKTAIIKDICKQLDLPVVIASSTNFSATGYVGATVTDLLEDLLRQSKNNIAKAECGIIVFDEIDKLAFNKGDVIGKDMREEVQHELLTFIGGGEYDVTVAGDGFGIFPERKKFNTSKITFILSGAFTDLREEKIKEVDSSHQVMGFSAVNNDKYEREYIVTPDDYINYGLMREFFGRIKVLASTKSYTLEDYKKILLESSISPLRNLEKDVKMYGYPGITFDEEFLNKVAEEGMKMKTGARGLITVMSGIENNMLDGLINREFDMDKPIELNTDMIKEYKKVFVRKY
ncbi:MAG: AAA family ATPase [Bacilli bacterium]|nr:AAA family ATPase [Bacilli bacterium]